MLVLSAVTKSWRHPTGDRSVLASFSAAFPRSGRVVIIGGSGSGKSTLLHAIGGLLQLDKGEITLNGCSGWRKPGVAALLPQLPPLFPWLNSYENLCEVYKLIGRSVDPDAVARVVNTFELGTYLKLYPHELSGGWKHLVGFAMVSLLSPKLLLLDEPLASVDEFRKIGLWRRWDRATGRLRDSLQIVVTHDIFEATAIADEIYLCSGPPLRILEVIKGVSEKSQRQVVDHIRQTFESDGCEREHS